MMKLSIRDMILIGLFAALMVVGAYLKIPNPLNPSVPITLQLFFCIYAGILLGAYKGLLSQLIYVALGLVGLPVFSGGGGLNYIFMPTFGYVIGFALCAFLVGYLMDLFGRFDRRTVFVIGTVGLLVAYLIGNTHLYVVVGTRSWFATQLVMLPYMVKDLLLVVVVAVSSAAIVPAVRKAGYAQ